MYQKALKALGEKRLLILYFTGWQKVQLV